MTIKDQQVWELYTSKVKAVPARSRKPQAAKAVPEKTVARQAAEKEPPQLPKLNAATQPASGLFDPLERKREKALRQGEVEFDAKLDLHGMTQAEAFAALADFMRKKTKAGKRHLLIVTGKGRGGTGVLRQSLENWLRQLPEAKTILALRPAAPKHGGDGAFYVLLRKK
jgi:DNA-nicking Smr family endonuclease